LHAEQLKALHPLVEDALSAGNGRRIDRDVRKAVFRYSIGAPPAIINNRAAGTYHGTVTRVMAYWYSTITITTAARLSTKAARFTICDGVPLKITSGS
jgi:hypothetical protein